MRFRISRRVGPLRFSAYQHGSSHHYADHAVLEAYRPNWLRRIAIIAAAFAPAWIAFGLGYGLLFGALVAIAGVGLLIAYGRSEAAYETDFKSFVAWCGTVTAGTSLAVLLGMLAEAIVS